jgi:hypothetical protein
MSSGTTRYSGPWCNVANTGDLFSPEELRKLPNRRGWLVRGRDGRLAKGERSQGKTPDHEGELAFLLRTQQRPPICMPEPATQYYWAREFGRQFHCDFAWPTFRLIVEVEGGLWRPQGVGAHSGGAAIERDIEKSQYACRLGWWLLRITEKDIKTGNALTVIQSTLERLGWKPGAPT